MANPREILQDIQNTFTQARKAISEDQTSNKITEKEANRRRDALSEWEDIFEKTGGDPANNLRTLQEYINSNYFDPFLEEEDNSAEAAEPAEPGSPPQITEKAKKQHNLLLDDDEGYDDDLDVVEISATEDDHSTSKELGNPGRIHNLSQIKTKKRGPILTKIIQKLKQLIEKASKMFPKKTNPFSFENPFYNQDPREDSPLKHKEGALRESKTGSDRGQLQFAKVDSDNFNPEKKGRDQQTPVKTESAPKKPKQAKESSPKDDPRHDGPETPDSETLGPQK